MTPTDPRHGTTRGYHAGCRELCCKRAMARYEKACRLDRLRGGRAVPALGAKRRLQALMRLGWSSQRIAAEAGLRHRNHVWRILHGQKGRPTQWIQRSTDQWVREVYDRLSMTVPEGHYVNRTRMYAERMGWPPPLAWDDIDDPDESPLNPHEGDVCKSIDEAVVVRVLSGETALAMVASPAERGEVAARWAASGRSLNDLARITGWKPERYWRATA